MALPQSEPRHVAPGAKRYERLPELVQRYAQLARVPADAPARQIMLTQTGRMWLAPGRRAMRFTATERFAVDQVGFTWKARFPLVPLVSLKVSDVYRGGRGRLDVRTLGLPLQRYSGHDADIGEAYRYLAELVWVPDAILANEQLDWRTVDARHVEVSTIVGTERVAVTLAFDSEGEIVRCCADARPRMVDGRSVPTPWGGSVSDYKQLGGRRLPTRAEVYWDLPEGRLVYWEAAVTSAEALTEPFAP